MITIAVANQKGGVAKTTTAVSLSGVLSSLGYRVLAVDADPQGNTSDSMGMPDDREEPSIYHVLTDKGADVGRAIRPTQWENLYVLPSDLDLALADTVLVQQYERESRLRRVLKSIPKQTGAAFDFAIIDCPPNLGIMTVNALVAADYVIIPVAADRYSQKGIRVFTDLIESMQDINEGLALMGGVITRYDARSNISKTFREKIREFFGADTFSTVIGQDVQLTYATDAGQPINYFNPKARAAQEYEMLTKEVLERVQSTESN